MLVLPILLISICIFSCQQIAPTYNDAIKKLTGKTWILTKRCFNDACDTVADNNLYFYFPKSCKNPIKSSDSACIQFDTYEREKDGGIKINEVFHSWILFFVDTSMTDGNTYPTVLTWGNFRQKGKIYFISDSEFVLVRHFPKFEIPNRDKDIETKNYFKLVNTPKDILDVDK